jgi:hypothetical protein
MTYQRTSYDDAKDAAKVRITHCTKSGHGITIQNGAPAPSGRGVTKWDDTHYTLTDRAMDAYQAQFARGEVVTDF